MSEAWAALAAASEAPVAEVTFLREDFYTRSQAGAVGASSREPPSSASDSAPDTGCPR